MLFEGCKGKPEATKLIEKECPQCGSIIEMFPCDTKMSCEKCGFIAYNDTISCIRWCASARACVGDEMYYHVQEMLRREKDET